MVALTLSAVVYCPAYAQELMNARRTAWFD